MNLAYRSYHTIPVKHHGKKSGLFFGFIRKALQYRRRYPEAKIIALWEGEGRNQRKDILESYKGNRENSVHRSDVPNDFQENLADVRKVLPLIDVLQAEYPALEADDLADYFINYRYAGSRFLLATNDTDWYTFLNSDNNVFIENKTGTVGFRKAHEKLGFNPAKMPLFKSIRGCQTDNVYQSINRISDERLAQAVDACDNLDVLIQLLLTSGFDVSEQLAETNHSLVSFYGDQITDFSERLKLTESVKGDEKLSNLCLKWGCLSLRRMAGLKPLSPAVKRPIDEDDDSTVNKNRGVQLDRKQHRSAMRRIESRMAKDWKRG